MEEMKKVYLTGSFSLLTRVAGDGEEARRPGTTEGGGAAMRGETAREAGRERRSGGGGCAPSLGGATGGVGRWDVGEESSWCSCASRGIPVPFGRERWVVVG